MYLFSAVIIGQNLSQTFLAARIDVCSIKVIDPVADGQHDFLFRFFMDDFSVFLCETHTSKAQNGQWSSFLIRAVLHMDLPFLCGRGFRRGFTGARGKLYFFHRGSFLKFVFYSL